MRQRRLEPMQLPCSPGSIIRLELSGMQACPESAQLACAQMGGLRNEQEEAGTAADGIEESWAG